MTFSRTVHDRIHGCWPQCAAKNGPRPPPERRLPCARGAATARPEARGSSPRSAATNADFPAPTSPSTQSKPPRPSVRLTSRRQKAPGGAPGHSKLAACAETSGPLGTSLETASCSPPNSRPDRDSRELAAINFSIRDSATLASPNKLSIRGNMSMPVRMHGFTTEMTTKKRSGVTRSAPSKRARLASTRTVQKMGTAVATAKLSVFHRCTLRNAASSENRSSSIRSRNDGSQPFIRTGRMPCTSCVDSAMRRSVQPERLRRAIWMCIWMRLWTTCAVIKKKMLEKAAS
mmetsp:Transcript_73249/g.238238  ORF Transcript_73249/g.238238 Transcript_73249/m.238238 type:complete len:289 (+) Transcript_73249:2423-3289(+)